MQSLYFADDNNTINLAIGYGTSHVFSASIQVKPKCKIAEGFNFKPFVGLNYSFTKQFTYEEKNADNKGLKKQCCYNGTARGRIWYYTHIVYAT